MKKENIIEKAVAGLGSAAFAIALVACAHHNAATDQGYGQIRPDQPTAAADSSKTVGVVTAPANTEGISGTTTPAALPGPAAVDSSGRAYTSSSVGSAGNAAVIGTNTNVNLIPKKVNGSSTVVTESAATVETTTPVTIAEVPAPPAPAPVIVETPAPAPMVVETPAPAPTVVETPTPAPMSSSTTEETPAPKTHRKMHKD
jgi:hypothetical protein